MATPIRVLIIDDSDDILFILKTELEHFGYVVDIAADPMEGLRMAEARSPDVIVSDIGLPGLDGFELIKRIRQRPELSSAPVIALTGLDSEDDAASMQAHGFSGHLVKPVDGATVAALIQSVIPRQRK
jgi:CheY-like chemotaxis protein